MPERKTLEDLPKAKMKQSFENTSQKLKTLSIDSLSDTAKKKIAKTIISVKNGGETQTAIKGKNVKYAEGSSQSEIPIKGIKDGFIHTTDDRWVGIIEVLPVDFEKKQKKERDLIISNYAALFERQEYKMSFHALLDTSSPRELIKNISKKCKNQDHPRIKHALEEHIHFLQEIGNSDSVSKRFFICFEYRDDHGRAAGKEEEVIESMRQKRMDIRDIMTSCGNICLVPKKETEYVTEILYIFLNRNSSKVESMKEKYQRMSSDIDIYNEMTGSNRTVNYSDVLAQKGLYFDNRNYIYEDGFYYDFLGIDGDTWPTSVPYAWLDYLMFGPMMDLHLIIKKLPTEETKLALQASNSIVNTNMNSYYNRGKQGRYEKSRNKLTNNSMVYKGMQNGSALYDAAIILSVRAYTLKDLKYYSHTIKQRLKKSRIRVIDSCRREEDLYKLTLPFLYITPIFNKLKHNILASDLATTYFYTSFELNDPTGAVLGKNKDNGSLASINNFNTAYFTNANILLAGASGAGKTFAEQLISRRMYMAGNRCFCIIPKKGYEHQWNCKSLDGKYIAIYPGSKDVINIMEIRPEGKFNEALVSENVVRQNGSWLSKKINSIIMWIQLLLGSRTLTIKEYNTLNALIKSIYKEYGITDDNKSIFEDIKTKKLKKMPIIGDVYEKAKQNPELDIVTDVLTIFVEGNCSNMNQQTNVDLDADFIVFDNDEDNIGERLLPSFLYISFDCVYAKVKEDVSSKDLILLDEVWKMLATEDCAKQVENIVRLVRGYGGATLMATQQLNDFENAPGDFGKTVIKNSEITLLLKTKPTELDCVKKSLGITPDEYNKITKFASGNAMLISGDKRVHIEMKASKEEYYLFTTNPNDYEEKQKWLKKLNLIA